MKAAIELINTEIRNLKQQRDFPPPNPTNSPVTARIIRVANEQLTSEISELEQALKILLV